MNYNNYINIQHREISKEKVELKLNTIIIKMVTNLYRYLF